MTACDDSTLKTERLELARRHFRQYHAQCFWFLRKDLEIAAQDIPEITRGLRRDGGRQGYLLASRRCPSRNFKSAS